MSLSRRTFFKGIAAAVALTVVPFKFAYKKARNVFTGANVRLYIDGKEVGYARNVNVTITDVGTGFPVENVGVYGPVELQARLIKGPETDRFLENLTQGDEE